MFQNLSKKVVTLAPAFFKQDKFVKNYVLGPLFFKNENGATLPFFSLISFTYC